MTKRKIKKAAKKFLDGKIHINRTSMGGDGNGLLIEDYVLPLSYGERFERAVKVEATRRGWYGDHWTNPFRIGYWDGNNEVYEVNDNWTGGVYHHEL